MNNKLVTSLVGLLLITKLSAQIVKDTVNKKIQQEPVEVVANIASEKSPFTKQKITAASIAKMNLGQDIPFLLNQTPSVIINSDAGNGIGYTGIRIRGTDATRINMTINGVPYNDAESQGIFFVDLPDFASSVNSLQIQRGVGSSSNGAASFGGTLGFTTAVPSMDKPSIEFNNTVGSFNTRKHNVLLQSGKIGKYFSVGTRVSTIKSDGFVDRAASNLSSSLATLNFEKNKTIVKFNWITGKEKTYQAWYGIAEADRLNNRTYNSAGMERPDAPYKNETDNFTQKHYQLVWNQTWNSQLNFSTTSFLSTGSGYYEQYKANQKYSKYGFANVLIGSTAFSRTDLVRQLWLENNFYGQIYSFNYTKDKTKISFGGGITKYDGNHFGEIIWSQNGLGNNPTRWYDLDAVKKDFNTYLKWEQRVQDGLTLYTDAQVRTVNYTINGFRNNPTLKVANRYSFFNPKIGINYDASLYRLTASYAVANKEPNREDFEANILQQPKPEQLQDIELNFIPRLRNGLQLSATAYYMHYNNQLVLTGKINDVGAYTRENIRKSYRAGIEVQLENKFTKWLKIGANITFSKNKIKNFIEYVDDYDNGGQITIAHTKKDIAYSPNIIAAATITLQPIKDVEISLLEKYVSKQYLDNTQNGNRQLNAYFTQDVLVNYTMEKKKSLHK
jgi:iron complex outermembrane recepter protein